MGHRQLILRNTDLQKSTACEGHTSGVQGLRVKRSSVLTTLRLQCKYPVEHRVIYMVCTCICLCMYAVLYLCAHICSWLKKRSVLLEEQACE